MDFCRTLRFRRTAAVLLAVLPLAAPLRAAGLGSAAAAGRASTQRARLGSKVLLTVASATGGAGNAVTLLATVDGQPGTVPGGSVLFSAGDRVLGTAPVAGGSASLTVSALPAGLSSLSASYQGDGNFLPSKSATIRFYNDDQD